MELIVDGDVYRLQTSGGISRIFDNILPLMCDLEPDLKVKILNHRIIKNKLPQHLNISELFLNKWDNYFRPWRFWHKAYPRIHNIYLRLSLGDNKEKFWFSTYYRVPPIKWNGFQIVYAYDFIHELFNPMLPDSVSVISLKKDAILNSDAVICISRSTARDLVKYYPIDESKIFVVELGYDPIYKQRTAEKISKKIDQPFILYVGKRHYYKNFNILLRAYAQWKKRFKIKLILVGPPLTSEEENLIKNFNLSDQVLLLQDLNDDHLCDLYNQAKVFVYPSLYEGFGIPLLEAMACGCPIVASQIPSTIEVAKDIPIYFMPSDESGLINALNQAIENGKDIERIHQGLSIAAQFSWEKTARKVLNVLKSISIRN